MDQKVIYCGVFNCPDSECKHHIKNGEKFDAPQRFNNLMYSPMCKLKHNGHCGNEQKTGDTDVV